MKNSTNKLTENYRDNNKLRKKLRSVDNFNTRSTTRCMENEFSNFVIVQSGDKLSSVFLC